MSRIDEAPEPQSLAAQLAELGNRPVGDRRADRLRARLIAWTERATTWGPLGPVAEIGWQTARRDASIGGSVLAAALAYRAFIWLLPVALAAVLGLGIATEGTGGSSSDLLADAGLSGYVASSVAAASEGTRGWARVTGLVVALVVVLYQSYALLRALRAANALAWRLPVRPPPNPARATIAFLGLIIAFMLVSSSAHAIRRNLDLPLDVVAGIAAYALLPIFYAAASWWLLPHRADRWSAVVPGSVLVGVAMAAIGLFNALVLFPWLARQKETYGVLGIAAGLLFSFFLVGRAVSTAGSLNATMWERSRPRTLAR